jgi:hypothetical protein
VGGGAGAGVDAGGGAGAGVDAGGGAGAGADAGGGAGAGADAGGGVGAGADVGGGADSVNLIAAGLGVCRRSFSSQCSPDISFGGDGVVGVIGGDPRRPRSSS